MAFPALAAMPSEYTLEFSQMLPPGWRTDLWVAASFVGVSAMIIGINRYQRAGQTGDGRGRRWANVLTVIAAMGAMIWASPLWILADNGL